MHKAIPKQSGPIQKQKGLLVVPGKAGRNQDYGTCTEPIQPWLALSTQQVPVDQSGPL